jgi:hypothetical protein
MKINKKNKVISRLLAITGMGLLIFAGFDWGVLLIAPAFYLRKDWIDKKLNREFIEKNKMICYCIFGYMLLASSTLLGISLINSIWYSKYNTADFKTIAFVYFIPAFVFFTIYEFWLSKNEAMHNSGIESG